LALFNRFFFLARGPADLIFLACLAGSREISCSFFSFSFSSVVVFLICYIRLCFFGFSPLSAGLWHRTLLLHGDVPSFPTFPTAVILFPLFFVLSFKAFFFSVYVPNGTSLSSVFAFRHIEQGMALGVLQPLFLVFFFPLSFAFFRASFCI